MRVLQGGLSAMQLSRTHSGLVIVSLPGFSLGSHVVQLVNQRIWDAFCAAFLSLRRESFKGNENELTVHYFGAVTSCRGCLDDLSALVVGNRTSGHEVLYGSITDLVNMGKTVLTVYESGCETVGVIDRYCWSDSELCLSSNCRVQRTLAADVPDWSTIEPGPPFRMNPAFFPLKKEGDGVYQFELHNGTWGKIGPMRT